MNRSTGPARHAGGHGPCLVAARLAAAAVQVPLDALLHERRLDRRGSSARALAMYLAHVGLGLSMSRVARGFGRHRSTVAYACRKIEERREVAGWDDRVALLEDEVRGALVRGGFHG